MSSWKRRIAVAMAGILVTGGVTYLFNYIQQERYRKITIGRDTTYVTGPQFADGRPNFLAAVNGKLGEGVTPENNALVPLYLATNPKAFYTDQKLEAFRQAVGVKQLPKVEETYVGFADFLFERAVKAATRPQQVRNQEGDLRDQWYDQEKALGSKPWTREENPDAYAWLERNKHVLELAREAGRRERYFSPLLARPDLGSTLLAFEGPLAAIRQYADLLSVDAMLAAGSGDFTRWREDVLAEKRLGRHVLHSGSVIGSLVGVALTARADDTIVGGLKAIPARDAQALLADLRSLPRRVDINDCLDHYDRVGIIAEIFTMAHFGPSAADIHRENPAVPLPRPRSLGFQPPVHFDELLREYNDLVDRRVAAGRAATYSARKAAFAVLDADCRARKAAAMGNSTTAAIRQLYLSGFDRANSASLLQDRMLEEGRLAELALLMVVYRSEHGNYPLTLAELGATTEAAKDLFADDAPVHYAPEAGLIYSVGPNQRDDKGVLDRPVDKRPLSALLSGAPGPVADFPDDISVKLP